MKDLPPTFNARGKSIADKPMFRDAFHQRRCIIPASGFYEWTGIKTARQPHLFTAADSSPILALAGLWERWRDPASGDAVQSCTIIVCGANNWMERYHDRMPVILPGAHRGLVGRVTWSRGTDMRAGRDAARVAGVAAAE